MNIIYRFLIIIFSLVPVSSYAHVKWFAEEVVAVPAYSVSDTVVLIWVLASVLLILVGIYLEKKIKVSNRFLIWVNKYHSNVLSIASIGFGIAFIIFAIKGFIFAPNLPAQGSFGQVMLGLEFLLGIMILFGIYERLAGGLILVLFTLGIKEWGAVEMLDTLEVLGFAIYIIIAGRPKWKIIEFKKFQDNFSSLKTYAVPVLRVGTGLNLIVLGFTEKILNPSLTANFLSNYHWNFMQAIGLEFSNYYFALSAGVVEVLFGIFLILGLITRITTLVLAIFLFTTLYLLGPIELIGHLPHFSIAIVLLLLGSGEKLKI